MANMKKQYFLAPTWDNPPNGFISLGNIIFSPKRPVPAHIAVTSITAPGASELTQCQKKEVTWTQEKAHSGVFGVYTKFLQMIFGIGVDVSVELEKKGSRRFEFETMDTMEFYPSQEYLKMRMADPKLQAYLALKWQKKFYMINGIKIVHGAKAKSEESNNVKTSVDAGVDGTVVAQTPVQVGAKVTPAVKSTETGTFAGSDDFVFAFRVLKIVVKDGSAEVSIKDSGAMYTEADEEKKEYSFDIEEVKKVGDEVVEDDEVVVVADPNTFEE